MIKQILILTIHLSISFCQIDPKLIIQFLLANKAQDTLFYSGNSINDLGDYKQCIKSNDNYFSINAVNKLFYNNPISIGICVEKIITKNEVKAAIDRFVDQKTIESFGIKKEDIRVLQPSVYQASKGTAFYFVVILYVAIFGLAISAYLARKAGFDKQTPTGILLESFDPVNNYELIFKKARRRNPKWNLDFMDVLRGFSTIIVIYGHEYFLRMASVTNIETELPTFFDSGTFLFLYFCLYSVDIFFFLSGFFLAFSTIPKLYNKNPSIMSFLKTLANRYLRLMPLYFFMMCCYWQLVTHLGEGPKWEYWEYQTNQCDVMWRNLLFIDNLFNQTNYYYCFGWGWYLSNDFQCAIISLMVLVVYIKYQKRLIAKLIFYFLIFIQILAALIYNIAKDLELLGFDQATSQKIDIFNDYYDKFYFRMAVYFIGTLAGIYFVEFKLYLEQQQIDLETYQQIDSEQPFLLNIRSTFNTKSFLHYLMILISLAIMIFMVAIKKDYQVNKNWSQATSIFFNVFERPIFITALFFFCVPSFVQLKHPYKFFNDLPFLKTISQFSYPFYLIHYQVIQFQVYSANQNLYYTNYQIFQKMLSDSVITLFFSILASLLIEQPFANLQMKFIAPRRTSVGQKNDYAKLVEQDVEKQTKDISDLSLQNKKPE